MKIKNNILQQIRHCENCEAIRGNISRSTSVRLLRFARNDGVWRLLIAFISILFSANISVAAQNTSVPINWQDENISWSELQSLFTNYPSMNQLNIKFPNGVVWVANENSLTNLYNKLGVTARNLSFSSVESDIMHSENSLRLPIAKIQNISDGFLRQMQYTQLKLPDYLPNWVKDIIVMICNGFMSLYDFALQEVRKFF